MKTISAEKMDDSLSLVLIVMTKLDIRRANLCLMDGAEHLSLSFGMQATRTNNQRGHFEKLVTRWASLSDFAIQNVAM